MWKAAKAPWKLSVVKQAILASAVYLVVYGAFSVASRAETSGPRVYNPNTKSYFQLFSDSSGNWETANKNAKTKIFKGVAGRLAHVEDKETHEFIVENLEIRNHKQPVWIGLRYWCSLKMLQWTSDRAYSPSDPGHFKIWHTDWSSGGRGGASACTLTASTGRRGYTPVYYRTINGITRWQAIGAAKAYNGYLVEYVTGGE